MGCAKHCCMASWFDVSAGTLKTLVHTNNRSSWVFSMSGASRDPPAGGWICGLRLASRDAAVQPAVVWSGTCGSDPKPRGNPGLHRRARRACRVGCAAAYDWMAVAYPPGCSGLAVGGPGWRRAWLGESGWRSGARSRPGRCRPLGATGLLACLSPGACEEGLL